MNHHTERTLRMLVARSSIGRDHEPIALANENLELVNLPYVDLRWANLEGAKLRGAMLWGACLDGACLDGADLTCADLTWSSLAGASLRSTLLVEADLDEAVVDGLGLQEANTAGADMCTMTFVAGSSKGSLEQARLEAPSEARQAAEEAALERHRQTAPLALRLRGATGFKLNEDQGLAGDWYEFKQDKFRRANARVLTDSDLQALLSWSQTSGKPLNLRGCNLSGAILRGARLDGACLAYADLTGADLRGASFVGADRTGSYGW